MSRDSIVDRIKIFDTVSFTDTEIKYSFPIDYFVKEPTGYASIGWHITGGTSIKFEWEISFDFESGDPTSATWIPGVDCIIDGSSGTSIIDAALVGNGAANVKTLIAPSIRIKATATGAFSNVDVWFIFQ